MVQPVTLQFLIMHISALSVLIIQDMERDPIQLLLDSVIPVTPDLTWETVYAFDAALRFKTLGIITAEIDFYKKTTKDMLMQIPWSYTTGFDASYGNIGSMTNTGVDVNVQSRHYQNTGLVLGCALQLQLQQEQDYRTFLGT